MSRATLLPCFIVLIHLLAGQPAQPVLAGGGQVILEVFQKKTRTAPKQVIETAKKRLRAYQRVTREE